MPEGVTGMDDDQVKIMLGALELGELSINDVYTPVQKVQMIYLETKFDLETA